jgi:hypothetical protein
MDHGRRLVGFKLRNAEQWGPRAQYVLTNRLRCLLAWIREVRLLGV